MSDYLLGTSDYELQRLSEQQEIWAHTTAELLDRGGVGAGAAGLDIGCGPGLVLAELRRRVGEAGRLLGLDESEKWIRHVRGEIAKRGWSNVTAQCTRLETADLGPESFDFAVLRWVLGFVPDPAAGLSRVARALVPGGAILVQDYNHEGISVFPRSPGFEAVIRATRELYRRHGGDAWIAGRLPALCAEAGLEVESMEPQVLCGGPESDCARWLDTFFTFHAENMVAEGALSVAEQVAFREEWTALMQNEHATFFSPIVVGAVLRKPA